MSEQETNYEELEEDNPVVQQREHIKNLESQLRQERALRTAGLTLSERQEKALFAAHDGELSSDALRETASELGFVQREEEVEEVSEPKAKEQTQPTQIPQEEVQAHQSFVDASTGGQAPTSVDADQKVQEIRDRLFAGEYVPESEANKVLKDAGYRIGDFWDHRGGDPMNVPHTSPR